MIDDAVISGLRHWLSSSQAIADALLGEAFDPSIIAEAKVLGSSVETMPRDEQIAILKLVRTRVMLRTEFIEIKLDRSATLMRLGCVEGELGQDVTITIPARLTRRGCEARLAYPADDHRAPAQIDPQLIKLLAEAEQAHESRADRGVD